MALGLEAPRVVFSDDLEAIGRSLPPPDAQDCLVGTGVSSGAAEGVALILRSPGQAPPEARDFILVCPSTDPGWVPLFLRARGVVLETGGVLSHGAIVAREFGLPAVANIADACSRFKTGQRLRVDGGQGKVWLIP
jgi:pyruvate,water dikinase